MEKNFGLNELQSLRLEILKANGYDIRQAKAVVDFVVGEKAHDIPAQHILEDGVYIITKDGAVIPFIDEMQPAPHDVEYVGIVQGKRSLAVALTDVKGYAVTLTNNLDQTGESRYYIDRYEESVRNYDGEANTQHLREIGLNPQIELKDGEYIPSLGELYILCLNQYVINKGHLHNPVFFCIRMM